MIATIDDRPAPFILPTMSFKERSNNRKEVSVITTIHILLMVQYLFNTVRKVYNFSEHYQATLP